MESKKILYQTYDEIKNVYERNNIKCKEFDTLLNYREMVTDENIIYVMFKDEYSGRYFKSENDEDVEYNVILFHKNKILGKNTKYFTECYLLSIFDECIICNDETTNNTIQCNICGKPMCESCIDMLYKYDKNLKCPACRKSLV